MRRVAARCAGAPAGGCRWVPCVVPPAPATPRPARFREHSPARRSLPPCIPVRRARPYLGVQEARVGSEACLRGGGGGDFGA